MFEQSLQIEENYGKISLKWVNNNTDYQIMGSY